MLKAFKNSIGLFAIVHYHTSGGPDVARHLNKLQTHVEKPDVAKPDVAKPDVAKGRLISVSDSGNIFIQHLNGHTSWGFNIEDVDTYKFDRVKEKREDTDGTR